jgi:hypothetical protein
MATTTRNFSTGWLLETRTTPPLVAVSGIPVFALRSLPAPGGSVEIPRRFSSSSLPPSFASGRFAGFCSTGHQVAGF